MRDEKRGATSKRSSHTLKASFSLRRNVPVLFYRFTGALSLIPHPSSLIPLFILLGLACNLSANRASGIPPQVQATVETVISDMAEGRYEKIYQEAAEEWRHTSTLEQTKTFFNTLKTKLGGVRGRSFHTARDQHNTGGEIPGHSFVIIYHTVFERAEGMETFTLVERDGRWLLAGYFVNSDALK
ncbi:MAG TPA: DUF4019 domain-containing protein [Pyrinomonadaceae bacterium]|nr:DUF4019 domain-containing protein [Pyrinomonadaceae bacterium]